MSALAMITPTWNTGEWVDAMRRAAPGLDVRSWPDVGRLDEITYAACWLPPPDVFKPMANLQAIFSLGAGVDAILRDETLPKTIPLIRVADDDLTTRMSEYVLLHVLMHHREQRRLDASQRAGKWEPFAAFAAKDFCVGIMGLGVLGQDAAHKLAMMGYRLRGWSRSPKQVPSVACFSGAAGLDEFLSGTDILVCLLPATPDTRGILNRSLFQKLSRKGPFGAPILINAGRGALQNEPDILACLQDGTLRAATLDVFTTEPLAPTSPFWQQPGVTVTPHAAADSDPRAICAYIATQLERRAKGLDFQHKVDRSRGY